MTELQTQLTDLLDRIDTIRRRLDFPVKEQRIEELDKESVSPGFWDDQQDAQKKMQELSSLRESVELWNGMYQRAADAAEMVELAEDDPGLLTELEQEANAITAEFDRREFALALGGEHDRGAAIFSIHAGAGGTEAQDWTQMLMRMYLRWAEQHKYKTVITDMTEGEEAGIKSVTVEVDGEYAYGYLKAEKGTHRLVRLSPFDSGNRRHTSFAKVEVMPVLDEDIEVEIDPKDIQIEVFLSGGAGGQNVQKNATAVRIRHLPSGIIVTCQNERSQVQNKESAMKVLRGKLYEIEQERLAEEKARLKGQNVDANFGAQIRSYVLHPYQMVKDLRTDAETGNTTAVLDGDIDMFIEAWLKTQVGEEE
ncbi:MAG: peptide chain release factor 2 [Caldilineaceae bacterium]|nr:peptide chain release factor 2 [Caldilineaceae bacterium]MCB9156416.1 peptide chain release factor 2 [Caldilineaceae bacterium]